MIDFMRALIIFFSLFLSACQTYTVRKWTDPQSIGQFNQANSECEIKARAYASRQQQRVFDLCMQSAGYSLEIVTY